MKNYLAQVKRNKHEVSKVIHIYEIPVKHCKTTE